MELQRIPVAILSLALVTACFAQAPAAKQGGSSQSPTPLVDQHTAPELLQRISKMAAELKGVDQLTPSYVNSALGVHVKIEDKDSFTAQGDITPDWWWSVDKSTIEDVGARLDVGFNRTNEGWAPIAPICGEGFDQFADELTAAGFARSSGYGADGMLIYTNFDRGQIRIKVATKSAVDHPDDRHHECVWLVMISSR